MTTKIQRTALIDGLNRKKLLIQQNVLIWSDGHPSRYDWRRNKSPVYRVLIGELLLDNSKYERFIELFPSVDDFLGTDDEKLTEAIVDLRLGKYVNLFNRLAKILTSEGKPPSDHDAFASISGLDNCGIKAIFCFGYDLPVAVVNRHVFRMMKRIFSADLPTRTPAGLIEAICGSLAFVRNPQKYNSAILDLGELICRPRIPLCPSCPVNSECDKCRLQKLTSG